jgi:hypothetical protein
VRGVERWRERGKKREGGEWGTEGEGKGESVK